MELAPATNGTALADNPGFRNIYSAKRVML
jgi:hypothetical protein